MSSANAFKLDQSKILLFNSTKINDKLKVFADDKINVNEKFKSGLGGVENMVVKGENAGYQHFLLFPQCFQKPSFSGYLKVENVWG